MTDLTDRMRTCAAFITYATGERAFADDIVRVVNDAADLLIEASNLLEAAPAPPGEPMEIIKPLPSMSAEERSRIVTESYEAPPLADQYRAAASPNACPKCDSRAAKTVRREGRKLMLICPVCAASWPWQPRATWT